MKRRRKPPAKGPRGPRPHLSILFECCHVYGRIYLNHDGSAFAGHCPKCAMPVRIKTSPGGSTSRFWIAG